MAVPNENPKHLAFTVCVKNTDTENREYNLRTTDRACPDVDTSQGSKRDYLGNL